MIGTVFRSEDVPESDRFDYWRELIAQTRSNDFTSAHSAEFWGEVRLLELGPTTVMHTSFLPTRFRRSPRMVRQCDRELYHLTLMLDEGMALDHAGRTTTFNSHDLHLADSSHPYDFRPAYDRERRVVRGVGVDVPKALLPLPQHRVRELLNRRLSGHEGIGALLTDFLAGLDRQADTLRPSEASHMGRVVVDLLAAWIGQLLDADTALSSETRRTALTERIRAFVRQNLHDPELTPSAIAAAHHISVSYLHRLFQQQTQGETVAAWIRGQRLEGVRRDLADPALGTTPIHTLAARWNFPRAADFTRTFRAAYGLTPKQYRIQALSERA
ncbi:helix-turn-helix domain-containing protein [Streptomyces triticiradicis]|uniref:Helix-turn-helix domain-containing protein n=1 Tax=Streptomyces triticiradicis TaxID=2651189 RepID=A0A7J5D764_9ACTN|nr:helix-turn-helix domain-containing protein [Streptomyces triticiradicis]KAB1980228.1 helix-turn-helix domain-containing protein [Streptomyces triticiradicis]